LTGPLYGVAQELLGSGRAAEQVASTGTLARARGRRQSGGRPLRPLSRTARERLRDNVVITLVPAPLTKLSSSFGGRRLFWLSAVVGSGGFDDLVGGDGFVPRCQCRDVLVGSSSDVPSRDRCQLGGASLDQVGTPGGAGLRPLFSSLSKHQLMRILRAARAIEFQPNVEIIREGEAGKGLYTIADGSAMVLVDGNQLATLGPGSYFGEIAVIDGGPRTATIVAATRVSALELAPSAFLPILHSEPQLARALSAELCRRLHDTGRDSGDCGDDAPVDRAGSLSFARDCARPSIPIGLRERRLEDAGSGSVASSRGPSPSRWCNSTASSLT
jgi:CRP/FNR family transcriptional regulator, cyclic AMP receptor protein